MSEKKQILLAIDTKEDFVGFLDYLNKEKESNIFSFASIKMPTENNSEDHLKGTFYIFEIMEKLDIEHDVYGMYQDDYSAMEVYGRFLKDVNDIFKNYGIYDHNIIYFTTKLIILVNMAKTCKIDNLLICVENKNDINNKKSIIDFISEKSSINIITSVIDNVNNRFENDFLNEIKKTHDEPFNIKIDLAKNNLFLSEESFNEFFNKYLKFIIEESLNNRIKLKES